MQLNRIRKPAGLYVTFYKLTKKQFGKKMLAHHTSQDKRQFYEFSPSCRSSFFYFYEYLQKITILLCIMREDVNLLAVNLSQSPFATANHLWISYKQGSFIVKIR